MKFSTFPQQLASPQLQQPHLEEVESLEVPPSSKTFVGVWIIWFHLQLLLQLLKTLVNSRIQKTTASLELLEDPEALILNTPLKSLSCSLFKCCCCLLLFGNVTSVTMRKNSPSMSMLLPSTFPQTSQVLHSMVSSTAARFSHFTFSHLSSLSPSYNVIQFSSSAQHDFGFVQFLTESIWT